ncbi:armadillo-type protein [Powellomyces hirtus]|nr:armadillo-type protein [Powellomyces hirtus]
MEAFAAELVEVLKQVNSGNTARLQTATATLSNRFYSQIQCIPALFEIARGHPDVPIRQLAAVELRKQVKKQSGTWWETLDEALRNGIKTQILEVILSEPSKPVRHSMARVVSEIAKVEIPKEKWNDLLSFLYSCCQSSNAAHREVGVYVLDTLFEVIADTFVDRILQMMELLSKTLVDPESLQVRVTTLLVLGKIADYIDPEAQDEIKAFRNLLPGMVAVLQQCVASGDDDEAVKGIEVFDNLLVIESPLVSRHMPQLVEFFAGISANKDNGGKVRVAALSFLMWCTVYQKNKIVKLKLVSPIIASIVPIVAEEEPEDEDEDSPGRMALQVINSLSTNLPPAKVFPDCMQLVVQYMQNSDPNARKAAMLTFGMLVDGCSEHMRSRIGELLPLLFSGLQDSEGAVRRAACLALSALAEELADEIGMHHATILPVIVNLMNDPNHRTQRASCNALDAILEGLGDEILQYLPALMEKLIFLLDNAEQQVKGVAIACIGSAAHSSGDSFQPYFAEIMPRLQYCMGLQAKEVMDLRGLATDTISAVAEAVGKDVFRPYLNESMIQAVHGLELDDSRLRECSYIFFAVMSRVYEEEFAPYLTVIVPQLLKSCNEPEKDVADWPEQEDEEEEDISIDNEDDDHHAGYSLSSAIAEEKESAVDALGQICSASRKAFMPYVEDSVAAFITLLQHYHEGVRKSAVTSLFTFISTFYKMSNPPKWLPGLPLQIPVHESVSGLAKLSMDAMILLLDTEDDRSVVAQTFSEFTDALKEVGPAILADRQQSLAEVVLLVLQTEHRCQANGDEDDEMSGDGSILRRGGAPPEDDEDQAEYDAILISNAADLVGAMANALGPDFAPYFEEFLPLIGKYYKASRPTSDRSMAIGVVAESAFGLKKGVTPFTNDVLQLVLRALSDEEPEVRSNAAYAVGVLVEYTDVDLSTFYVQILQLLRPLFNASQEGNLADNATGAVCRMIAKNAAPIPLDQVLPVVLENLPLKRDFEENEPVYRCILHLVRSNNPMLLQNMSKLLNIFAQVLSPPEGQLKDATRADILELLRTLKTHHAETFQTIIAGMEPQYATALAHILQ